VAFGPFLGVLDEPVFSPRFFFFRFLLKALIGLWCVLEATCKSDSFRSRSKVHSPKERPRVGAAADSLGGVFLCPFSEISHLHYHNTFSSVSASSLSQYFYTFTMPHSGGHCANASFLK